MKYIKTFENTESVSKSFYNKLEKFFKEIADEEHVVVNTYYSSVYYSSVGIYLGPQDYIVKISEDIIMKRWNLNEYYPNIDVYLKSKLPLLPDYDNRIDLYKISEMIDTINFSKKEYEIYKDINKYNL